MSKQPSQLWAWVLGAAVVNFEGLAGFVLFLLLLAAVLLWHVYKFAQIVVPAISLAVLVLVLAFIPVHIWARTTIRERSRQRIARTLATIREQEQLHVPREQIIPLELRVRESAQALADRSYERLQEIGRGQPEGLDRLRQQRTLRQEIEDLRLSYDVVPEQSRGARFFRLHLECEWIRWLAEHPGPARILLLSVLAVLTTAVAALL